MFSQKGSVLSNPGHAALGAIRYFTIESTVAIFLSFIINTFVVGTFAASATWGSECTPGL